MQISTGKFYLTEAGRKVFVFHYSHMQNAYYAVTPGQVDVIRYNNRGDVTGGAMPPDYVHNAEEDPMDWMGQAPRLTFEAMKIMEEVKGLEND